MKISIIIPTYNEALSIAALLHYLLQHAPAAQIIVSDGGSTDTTIANAALPGVTVLTAPHKGRAAQMNFGASKATGDIFYFVHADTLPPANFVTDIFEAVKNNFDCGRYQTKFNSKKWIFKFNAFFTRFDWFICYGGDQTFFITKKLFTVLHGFKNDMLIMEEYDFTARAKQQGRYKIFNKTALISTRKYEGRSWWQVQMANRKAIQLFKSGAPPQQIAEQYKLMLKK